LSGGTVDSNGALRSPLRSAREKLRAASAMLESMRNSGAEPGSARDMRYSAVPTQDDLPGPVGSSNSKSRSFVDSTTCALFTSIVISANTVVIAMECQDIRNEPNQAFFRRLEVGFALIYTLEILLRIFSSGLNRFFCAYDAGERGWNTFDFIVTALGLVSALLDEASNVHLNASVVRVLRVLRILRVFRILKFLRDIEYTLISAMTSMFRVMILVLMIDFIGAVVITMLLKDTEDEMVREMFGNLTSSMFCLFEVMVDGMSAVHMSELDHHDGAVFIAQKVLEAHPRMWIFWVAFVFVGTISLMALVPAIFVELNLRDAEVADKKRAKKEWEQRVEIQRSALERVFFMADEDGSKAISREEMDNFLQTSDALVQIGLEASKETDDDEDPENAREQLDAKQLRMEFAMVFDAIEAEGRTELSCSEFIEAFRKMRAKPVDQVVLTLQQEIFKLRTLMVMQNRKLQDDLKVVSDAVGVNTKGRRMSSEVLERSSWASCRTMLQPIGWGGPP